MENYIKRKLIGGQLRLKKGVSPHKFDCQKHKNSVIKRPGYEKRRRKEYLENLMRQEVNHEILQQQPVELIEIKNITEDTEPTKIPEENCLDESPKCSEQWHTSSKVNTKTKVHNKALGIMENTLVKKNASYDQMVTLVSLMEDHTDVAKSKFTSIQGRLGQKDTWDAVAVQLNAMSTGTIKTADKWKQTWRDFKSNTKKKATKIRQSANESGGSTCDFGGLSELEMRVVNIIGEDSISDMTEVLETKIVDEAECKQNSRCRHENMDAKIIDIEKEKIQLEKEKIEIARQKLELERNYKGQKLLILERMAACLESMQQMTEQEP